MTPGSSGLPRRRSHGRRLWRRGCHGNGNESSVVFAAEDSFSVVPLKSRVTHRVRYHRGRHPNPLLQKQPDVETGVGVELIGDDLFASEILHRANFRPDDKSIFRPCSSVEPGGRSLRHFGVAHIQMMTVPEIRSTVPFFSDSTAFSRTSCGEVSTSRLFFCDDLICRRRAKRRWELER